MMASKKIVISDLTFCEIYLFGSVYTFGIKNVTPQSNRLTLQYTSWHGCLTFVGLCRIQGIILLSHGKFLHHLSNCSTIKFRGDSDGVLLLLCDNVIKGHLRKKKKITKNLIKVSSERFVLS